MLNHHMNGDRNGSGDMAGGGTESGEMGVAQAIPLEGARVVDMGNGHRVLVISSSPSRPAPAPGGDGTWLRRSDVVPVLVSSYDSRAASGGGAGGIPSVKSEGEGGDNNGLMRVLTFEGGAPYAGAPECREMEAWRRGSTGTGVVDKVMTKVPTEPQVVHANGGEASEESYAAGLSQNLVVHDDQHALLTG